MMKKKVLIIEDEKITRNIIEMLLKENDYDVTSAADGEEGIKKINEDEPDIILCDIIMPRKDGFEVFNAANNNTPFIFLTGRTDYTDFRKGMSLGADDYIIKPFDCDDLLQSIKVRLERYESLKKRSSINQEHNHKYSDDGNIFFRKNSHLVPVAVKDMAYISAERQYSCVFTGKRQKFFVKKSLTQWEKELPPNMFIRIHRSTLVNINFIRNIKKGMGTTHQISLYGMDKPLDISRRFYKNLRDLI